MSRNSLNFPVAERIQLRAQEIYAERGNKPGRDLDDWLAAEKELTDCYLEACFSTLSQQRTA